MTANDSMAGRTVLMTGATNGIGRVAAEGLARRGARLTIVGRNPEKTERVATEIRQATENADVDYLLADLSRVSQVRELARAVADKSDALDVLVNNAGAMFTRCHVTEDGYERTFALNHLAYFTLTNALLELLEKGVRPRVVNVASGAHFRGSIHFDDLMFERRRFRGFGAYSQSKLANVLFTRELARRLTDSPITVNCVHPGFVRTGFGHNDGVAFKALVSVMMLFARTSAKGAETVEWLASSAEADGQTGGYWMDKKERRPSREARDVEVATRLWEVSEALVARAS